MARNKQPELTFQDHSADYLLRMHKYGEFDDAYTINNINVLLTKATKPDILRPVS